MRAINILVNAVKCYLGMPENLVDANTKELYYIWYYIW